LEEPDVLGADGPWRVELEGPVSGTDSGGSGAVLLVAGGVVLAVGELLAADVPLCELEALDPPCWLGSTHSTSLGPALVAAWTSSAMLTLRVHATDAEPLVVGAGVDERAGVLGAGSETCGAGGAPDKPPGEVGEPADAPAALVRDPALFDPESLPSLSLSSSRPSSSLEFLPSLPPTPDPEDVSVDGLADAGAEPVGRLPLGAAVVALGEPAVPVVRPPPTPGGTSGPSPPAPPLAGTLGRGAEAPEVSCPEDEPDPASASPESFFSSSLPESLSESDEPESSPPDSPLSSPESSESESSSFFVGAGVWLARSAMSVRLAGSAASAPCSWVTPSTTRPQRQAPETAVSTRRRCGG
jgi:hypothetical protein